MNIQKHKILIVIPSLEIGGAERLLVYLLKYLDRNQFELALCLFKNKGELLSDIPPDVKTYFCLKKSRWSFFKLIFGINKVVKDFQPDLIYARMWYSTLVTILAKKIFKWTIPLAANEEHNHKRDIERFDIFGRLKKISMSWAYRQAEAVLVPSQGVRDEIVPAYRLDPNKTSVIYNAVDLNLIEESLNSSLVTEIPFADDQPIIAAFGRLIKRKGFDDLLQAFKIVRAKQPCHLIFIGDGEERQNLEHLADELQIKNDVKFMGFMKNPYSLLSRCRLFVLSSLWEGFGNVIIESMACGVPVVAVKCPYGPSEIITDCENGLLVPTGDISALANTMIKVLNDNTLQKHIGEAGKKRSKDFSVEIMVSKYESLLSCISTESFRGGL